MVDNPEVLTSLAPGLKLFPAGNTFKRSFYFKDRVGNQARREEGLREEHVPRDRRLVKPGKMRLQEGGRR